MADKLDEVMIPFKARYQEIIDNGSYLDVLRQGAEKARAVANKTLRKVQEAVGLLTL